MLYKLSERDKEREKQASLFISPSTDASDAVPLLEMLRPSVED